MSGSDSVTLTVGTARIEVPARDIVRSILGNLMESPAAPAPQHQYTPAIGQSWPEQGGIYAGLMRGADGSPDHHLIVPTDSNAFMREIAWGAQGKEEPRISSDFDGLTNTKALKNSKHSHPAAEWADGLVIDGFSDFYLPSRRELRLCWVNVPELFEEGWYWSSTQFSARSAWHQYFGDGDQSYDDKGNALRARAVRRLLVIQ